MPAINSGIPLEKKFGIKVTYVPFRGGGTVAKQLIGKHINSTVNNPSEQAGFWDAGKSRALASFTPPGKLKGKFGNIPTFQELGYGYDMVYYMQRSIIAPPGVGKDVQAAIIQPRWSFLGDRKMSDCLQRVNQVGDLVSIRGKRL